MLKQHIKIGCTYNITGFRELNQAFMLCETCEIITGEDVVVCLCCAEFCHKGHKMMKGNKGRKSRVVCSCGSNTFPKCPVNDQDNPLIKIKGPQSLPLTSCCLLKEYTANKKQIGKEIRDKIGQKDLKKAEMKKKRITPLNDDVLNNAKNQLDQLRKSPTHQRQEENKEESKLNRLPPPANTDNEEEDTIGKMEREINNITKDESKNLNLNSPNDEEFEGGFYETKGLFGEEDSEGEHSESESDSDNQDTNEAEEYEFMLLTYNSQNFIKDLIKCLKFDQTEIKKHCPKLFKRNFRLFDESLQRKVHLYEHIIHLAFGFIRPGFLKIITNRGLLSDDKLHRTSKPYEPGYNRFFDTCISFTSAFQGDLENFSKYCKGLLMALNLEGTTDFPAREKAITSLMLIKGDSIGGEIEGISATGDQYAGIFEKLFGKQSQKAMYLHKLGTMAEDDLITLFTAKEKQGKTTRIQNYKNLSEFLIDNFLVRHLEMDTDSIEWCSALTRIAAGDFDGFDYVAKEYDINNAKSSIYKAVCTRDYLQMDALFHAIDEEVPFELCTNLSWILNGDTDMLRDLILYRCHIEKGNTKFKITYDNVYKTDLPEEIEKEKQEMGDYLMVLFSLIEGESFDIGDLKKILHLCGVDEGMAFILAGFNALLNKDLVKVHDMFDFDQFNKEIDDIELVHAIIKIGSGKWDQESVEKVIKEIIISQNLYTHHNIDEKIKELVKSAEYKFIVNTLRGIDGDMQSLGQVCDYIFFNNKSWICTLFAVMSEGKLTLMNLCNNEDRDLAQKKFQKDVKRLFEKLFSVA